MERPSKYHDRHYVGTTKGDKDGYSWDWDSSHPELESTSTFQAHCDYYCTYCCAKAYPIQEGLRIDKYGYIDYHNRNFDITGYTCICESAEKEKELRHKLKKLEDEHKQEIYELKKQYKDFLKEDKHGRLNLQYKLDLKDLEWSEDSFRFNE